MDATDGMDCAARLSMEAKEYWVHLDAEGSLEKYPGGYQQGYTMHSLIDGRQRNSMLVVCRRSWGSMKG
jgi:hypothetical protein